MEQRFEIVGYFLPAFCINNGRGVVKCVQTAAEISERTVTSPKGLLIGLSQPIMPRNFDIFSECYQIGFHFRLRPCMSWRGASLLAAQ